MPGAASPEEVLVGGVAPTALALVVSVRRLAELASTDTLSAVTLRFNVASALSFRIAMPNEAPTPTLLPAAAASASTVRIILPSAETATSPVAVSVPACLPRYASEEMPEMASANTGTMDLPPAAPAAAKTVSVPVNDDLMEAEATGDVPKRTPSSTFARKSTPVTLTAIPAPMPTLPVALPVVGFSGIEMPAKSRLGVSRLPDASATVVNMPAPVDRTFTCPPDTSYVAPLPTSASLCATTTCTLTAPPRPKSEVFGMWPDFEIVEETIRPVSATTSSPSAAIVPAMTFALFTWLVIAIAMPAPTEFFASSAWLSGVL